MTKTTSNVRFDLNIYLNCIAAVAVLLAAGYMGVNAACTYRGSVSGLFQTGASVPVPPELAAHTARVAHEKGYDAQYYHFIAHDPLLQRGYGAYLDNVQLRWRRIAVPAMAWLLSFGSFVDYAYIAVELAFLYLGTLWFGKYVVSVGLSPLFALMFCAVPAVLTSIDRMMTDLPLAALTVGLLLSPSPWAILLLAPLVRETGIVLVIGAAVWFALQRERVRAVAAFACSVPAVLWWLWVRYAAPPDGTPWLAHYPFSGLIQRTLTGDTGPTTTLWLRLASITEEVAVAGIWLALILGVVAFWREPRRLPEICAIVFIAFASMLGKYDIWDSAYAAGRTMSPLLVLVAMIGLRERRWTYVLPLALILPRLLLQYQAQLTAAWRACAP